MDISYKGIWGYAPLVISLGNTKEVLYLVNRPGNSPSHDGCVEWIDRAIALVKGYAKRVNERIVEGRGYKNICLEEEHVAEFEYRPVKCKKSYRVVVIKKTLRVKKGQKRLFDDVRTFSTSQHGVIERWRKSWSWQTGRCNQENVVEQLKNGVNAMKMPVRDLESNWSYMVMAALAWNVKACLPVGRRGLGC